MTLCKSDDDGYFVISDSGHRYGLYELKCIGIDRTTDMVAIMHEDKPTDDGVETNFVDFLFVELGDDIKNPRELKFIKQSITSYEEKNSKDKQNFGGDVVTIF